MGACVLEESTLVLKQSDVASNANGPLLMSECSAPLVVADNAPPAHAHDHSVAAEA